MRSVYKKTVDDLKSREGFFQAAGELADDPLTDETVVARFDALRFWHSHNLELPERFSRSSSKGYYRRETKWFSWFKPTSKEHISKAFELKNILDENGSAIDALKESRIGYVVYEDENQIVAEPFAETAT